MEVTELWYGHLTDPPSARPYKKVLRWVGTETCDEIMVACGIPQPSCSEVTTSYSFLATVLSKSECGNAMEKPLR